MSRLSTYIGDSSWRQRIGLGIFLGWNFVRCEFTLDIKGESWFSLPAYLNLEPEWKKETLKRSQQSYIKMRDHSLYYAI
jgi:hypothetical protein